MRYKFMQIATIYPPELLNSVNPKIQYYYIYV